MKKPRSGLRSNFKKALPLLTVIFTVLCLFPVCEGPAGPMGPQGIQGDKGDKGDAGVSIVWKGELASPPSGAQLNWAYYNSVDKTAYIYDGSRWQILSKDGEASAPIVWKGEAVADLEDPQLNWAYYNSVDKVSYIYNGAVWQILAKDGEVGPQGPKGDTNDGIDRIAITGPTVTGYFQNASFSTAGLTVTAYYTDNSVATVTSGYSISWEGQPINTGNTAVTADVGTKTITVSWKGCIAPFTITVAEPDNIVVTNTNEWNNALSFISSGGNNKGYTVTVSGDVAVPGSTGNSFGTATGITVRLTGNGRLYLNSQGNMLRLRANQTLYIDSAGLTLEGLRSGQNGSSQDNNNSVVYIDSNATVELRNGTVTGNTNGGNGGGVFVSSSGRFSKSGGGVIYGNDAGSADKNTVSRGNTYGHAVYYRSSSSDYYRDTTLNAADDISTAGTLPTTSGQTLNGWTMR